MDDEAEFSGKTVEEAIRQAERELGASRDDLQISVITPGRSGVFGIGSEPARISARARSAVATVEAPEAPAEAPPVNGAVVESVDSYDVMFDEHDEPDDDSPFEDEDDDMPAVATAPRRDAQREVDGNLAEQAREVLIELLDVMGFDSDVTVSSTEEPIMLSIQGDNLGVLIGRRGDNLAALQFMVNLILSKNRRQWPRVVVDVENYRERREESLRSLADRIAERVRRSNRAFTLEAMPAGDRRIIHLTLRDADDVETYSIGEGPSRRVVVAPTRPGQGQSSRASS